MGEIRTEHMYLYIIFLSNKILYNIVIKVINISCRKTTSTCQNYTYYKYDEYTHSSNNLK